MMSIRHESDDVQGERTQQPLMDRPMSRRSMLSALGFAGAALAAEHFLKGPLARTAFGQGAPAVTDAVYGDDDKNKPPLLMNMSYIIAVTLAELRGMEEPREDLIYFVTDPGQEGHFIYDPADNTSPDNTGTIVASVAGARFKRLHDGSVNAAWFGAVGDGMSDDTEAVRSALGAARGKSLFFPPGVFRLTDTLIIPRNTFVRGSGASSWYAFGQRRNEVPDSILDMENGTVLMFTGNGSRTYSSNRDDFRDFTCAVKLDADADGTQLSDLKILSDFKIRDALGNITTQLTDEHAMFDVGLWIDNATHVKLDRVSVVGYWQKAGVFLDASGRLSTTAEYGSIEYATIKDCLFQGKIGLAVLGGDEGNPPDVAGFTPPVDDARTEGQFGLSHLLVSDSFFSGTDHHSNGFAPGWESRIEPDSTPIKIDGFIGSGVPYRINHPRFVNCSIQTRESASIVLDRVIRPTFINCRAESGPVRASQYTVLPRLINCEFPYNRSKTEFQEMEHCQGAWIVPGMRRLGHIHLREYHFQVELRNNNGAIEHRLTKAGAMQPSTARSFDVEALFRYAVQEASWDYRSWTPLPLPGGTGSDDFSKGMFLGEKAFQSKYALFTAAAIDNHPDYQEAEAAVALNRTSDTALWIRPAAYTSQNVPYRMKNYSNVLKLELRSGDGPAASLLTALPEESGGSASLVISVRGKFYEQAYGLV
ncbi:glycosyl hydrolase family 28-related protein [Paenibacillus sp. FSL W7-1279]|uniref:glycosyl hydrolase family 28-related protein n=1 Tax=unclassified Paenibacillus TaxID=185978 RepID=UPI00188D9A27|nr:glycosyl hydrolase family 28-related protein [Paenibacillus sp. JZ16]